MPWTPADAVHKTRKATSKKRRRQWRDVANSVLKKTGDEGRAVREANAVVGAMHERHGMPKHKHKTESKAALMSQGLAWRKPFH